MTGASGSLSVLGPPLDGAPQGADVPAGPTSPLPGPWNLGHEKMDNPFEQTPCSASRRRDDRGGRRSVVFTIANGCNHHNWRGRGCGSGSGAAADRNTAQLTEVKITFSQVSEWQLFVVNNDARQVAWKLYIETVTGLNRARQGATKKVFICEALTSLMASSRRPVTRLRPAVHRCLSPAVRPSSTWWSPCSTTSYDHSCPVAPTVARVREGTP